MPARTQTPIKALISRDISHLGLGQTKPLHPDPSKPIIDARAGTLPMGLGENAAAASTTILPSGKGMVVGKVVANALRNQRLNLNYYHTTTKTHPLHVCARARLHAHGSVYIYGSMVVDRYKPLIRKGKWHYFCPLPCHYHAAAMVVVLSNPLKSFEKGDF